MEIRVKNFVVYIFSLFSVFNYDLITYIINFIIGKLEAQ